MEYTRVEHLVLLLRRALDLDAVVEELLEGGDIGDLVAGGLRSVDDELHMGC